MVFVLRRASSTRGDRLERRFAMPRPSPLLARWHRFALRDAPAVIDANGTHTYREIDAGARRVAAWLLEQGLGSVPPREAPRAKKTLEGERVALLLEPGADFVSAFFGVLLAGGCVVVLSPLHPPAETTYFMDDAHVRTILTSPGSFAERARALLAGAGTRRRVIELSPPLPGETLASDAGPGATQEDAALQLYTSGTTGKPKGAVLTHENLGIQQVLLGEAWGWSETDRLLHALPLHHLHGLGIALLTALGAGASVRMLPFDAGAVWNAMRSSSVFMGVPTMYAKLFARFDTADEATRARWSRAARTLRLATSGSAALPVSLGERWRTITGHYPLERFGMTEIGVGLSNPLHGERRPGFVGQPLRTVETCIKDDSGADAVEGELWVRGPSVFLRYHEREEATAQAFVKDPAGGAPWFRTGDTVTKDATGSYRILGRTSVDILKSGGYKLSALEIEEVLREHAAVAEVAVIGLPDPTWGEKVVACVVAREGMETLCAEVTLRAFAKERLAPYKVPKEVVLFSELPRNAVGKVLKPELARRLGGGGSSRD
jgi:malonyl-CoA/methylmalonyl-CoA synthetase